MIHNHDVSFMRLNLLDPGSRAKKRPGRSIPPRGPPRSAQNRCAILHQAASLRQSQSESRRLEAQHPPIQGQMGLAVLKVGRGLPPLLDLVPRHLVDGDALAFLDPGQDPP